MVPIWRTEISQNKKKTKNEERVLERTEGDMDKKVETVKSHDFLTRS